MRPAAIHYQSMSGSRSERVIFPLALIGFWLLQATPEAHPRSPPLKPTPRPRLLRARAELLSTPQH